MRLNAPTRAIMACGSIMEMYQALWAAVMVFLPLQTSTTVIIKAHLLNNWTRADLQDKPASQGKAVTLVQMAEILKAAGVTTIQI